MTGKPTLPVLAALGELSAGEAQRLRNVVSGWVPSRTEELLELLDQAGSLAECQRVIDELLDEARAAVAMVPPDAGLDGLLALCDCLATQTAGLEDC
jgi:geranylgeranyl pyrophosphate synthase